MQKMINQSASLQHQQQRQQHLKTWQLQRQRPCLQLGSKQLLLQRRVQ